MSAKSQWRNNGAGPEAPIFATKSLDGSTAISTKPTFAFWAAKASTMAAPIPEPPPVMKTTRSSSEG